jgi:predicted NACHT family NTPase
VHRPEVEAVYVPVSVETALSAKNDKESLHVMDRRTTFAVAWEDWQPAKHGPMVVLGGPGAGKTTLLKHLGLRALPFVS